MGEWRGDWHLPRDWVGYVITFPSTLTELNILDYQKDRKKVRRIYSDPIPGASRTSLTPCCSQRWRGLMPLQANVSLSEFFHEQGLKDWIGEGVGTPNLSIGTCAELIGPELKIVASLTLTGETFSDSDLPY